MPRTHNIAAWLGLSLAIMAALTCQTACAPETVPKGRVVFEHDSAVRDETSPGLNFKMLNFEWRYLAPTEQIQVIGFAQNMTPDSVQGCRLIASGYDQFNSPLGTAEVFLTPTYIPPGQKGRFEMFFQRGEWVKAIRLRYRFEARF
ncbi:MAG: hypothetical protein AB1641_07760 [Thermodesulfobacteriota bacterium]